MTTLAQLKSRTLRLIGNSSGEGIEDGLIIDAISAAFDAILPWIPKLATSYLTGDGALKAFDLPADFYSMDAVVYRETGEVLAQAIFAPLSYYGEDIEATNNWLLLPTGKLSFSKTPDTGQIFDLYYCATWTKPTIDTNESEELEPPSYLEYAIALYSAAYILMPDTVSYSTGIGPYKTKVDSGNPEHNPIQKQLNFLLSQFAAEIGRHPRHIRGQV